MKDGKRLYYRFRAAPYYGGIATADAIGCSFLCAYCWNYFRNLNPARFDKFYSSQQVAENLLRIARKRSFHLFRITGSEPLLGEASLEHLRGVLKIIFQEEPRSVFILETNGFFLGCRKDLVKKLIFKNLWIRISLKGVNEESFELISGAKKEFFRYPLVALKELEKEGMKAWPAVMRDLFSDEDIGRLEKVLEDYGIGVQLEQEVLEEYPFVTENMKRRNVWIKS
ncbi:MAG: 4Fe-4S cluster-binding domain-containing protein [Candidatus Aminicenantes bacterium]|nr:4Fe-4S cluster-binding domain-containing protein [Candidatus Aminicenantes bacterium]